MIGGDTIRLVKNAFAYCFKEAKLSTTGSGDTEHNKYVGQVSTTVRILASKDGNVISHFDKIVEVQSEFKNTSLNHMLINNHDIALNKENYKDNYH